MRKAIRTHRVAALFGGALVLATLTSLHLYLNWRLYGDTASYATVWLGEAIEWTIWAAFVPVVWTFERRFGTATRRIAPAIAGHGVVLLAFYGLLNVVMTGVALAIGAASLEGGTFAQLWLLRAINHAPSAVIIYGLIVGAAVVTRVSAAHARQRAALESQLSEARLRYLRAQIQPHFLFNTLHGIAGLVREGERDEAVKIIGLLGRLLRRALAGEGEAAVELADELEDLWTYVDIQRMRFGDRLTVTSDVPVSLASVRVPGILLQPLVENSIRHGLGPDGGHVHVSAARENGTVVLEVRDDGTGFSPGFREGVGIGNLRARLEAMYGAAAELELRDLAPAGAGVRIRLPIDPTRP